MILRQVNSKQRLIGVIGLVVLGAAACGSEARPSGSADPVALAQPDPEEAQVGFHAVGVATGTYRDGHISIGPIVSPETGTVAPGVKPQGFGTFTQSLISFDTAAGDGVQTGTCTATQYCGTVSLTNGTGVAMANTFVEITDYFNVLPVGTPITWAGTPFTKSNAYASVFVNSGSVAAADYGSFTASQVKPLEFKFNVGAATTFDFHVKVYATFSRQAASASAVKKVSPVVDACGTSGHSSLLTATDDAETNFELPFPFTLYDLTYDRAVVGSNGYVLLYSTGGTPRTLTGNNTSISIAGYPQGFYVFWDDLSFDAGDGVCTAVTGTTPNRVFTVTWKNAKIATSQPGKTTWSAEKITYSLTLRELTDQYSYVYNLPLGGFTNLTRSSSATTGVFVVRSAKEFANTFSFNSLSTFIPGVTTDYPEKFTGTQVAVNP
jgi:hypothetical protein